MTTQDSNIIKDSSSKFNLEDIILKGKKKKSIIPG